MFRTVLGLLVAMGGCVRFAGGVRAASGGSVCIIYFKFLLSHLTFLILHSPLFTLTQNRFVLSSSSFCTGNFPSKTNLDSNRSDLTLYEQKPASDFQPPTHHRIDNNIHLQASRV